MFLFGRDAERLRRLENYARVTSERIKFMAIDLAGLHNAVTNAVAVMQAASERMDALAAQNAQSEEINVLAEQLRAATESLAQKVA